MPTVNEFTHDIEQYKSGVCKALADYLNDQHAFFSDYKIRAVDFEFNPDHDFQLLISFLVEGEEAWQEKSDPQGDYYTTDWKYHMFNLDFTGHESDELNEALYLELDDLDDLDYGPLNQFYDELYKHLASVVKSDLVMEAINSFQHSKQFDVFMIDPRDEDIDYMQLETAAFQYQS